MSLDELADSSRKDSSRIFLAENLRWLGAIVGFALGVRVFHLLAIRHTPLFHYLISDSRVYAQWGREIATGDWLGLTRGVFYQPPLYSYLLGVVFSLGGDLETVRWIQVGLSAISCGLMAWAGALLFGRRAGIASGVILALYAPAVFFDGLVQKESVGLILFAGLLLCWAQVTGKPEHSGIWFRIGALLGALCLLRENALVLVPLFGGFTLLQARGKGRSLLAFSLGLVALLAPVAVRNGLVGGQWALTTSQSGPNFYLGNHRGASGIYEPLRAGRSDTPFEREDAEALAQQATGRDLSPREVSGYWWGEGLSFWRHHGLEALGLLGRKSLLVFHVHELADAEDLYLARRDSWVLRALSPVGMGLLLPLAIFGLVAAWPEPRVMELLGVVVVFGAAVAFFFVMARYRFYLVPPLILLAGGGMTSLLEWRRLSPARWKVGIGAVTILSVAIWFPIERVAPLDRSMAWVNRGVALAGLGRLEEALVDYRRALNLNPRSIEANADLGSTLRVLGRPAEALPYLEVAANLAPEDGAIQADLGATRFDLGHWSAAVRHLETAWAKGGQRRPELGSLLQEARRRAAHQERDR